MNVKMCESHRAHFILKLYFSKLDELPLAQKVFFIHDPAFIQVTLQFRQLCEATSSLSRTGCLFAFFFHVFLIVCFYLE